jgi:hypothetical protein
MDRDGMSNLYRGPSIDASYQTSVHLAKRLQKRRIFKISQSETRAELQIKKKSCQTLSPASKRVLPDLSTFCQTYIFFLEIF